MLPLGKFKGILQFSSEKIFHKRNCPRMIMCLHLSAEWTLTEVKIGHIVEMSRAKNMFKKHVSKKYWGEAVLKSTHLINRLITMNLGDKSPLMLLSSHYSVVKLMNYFVLRIFGCIAYIHVHYQIQVNLALDLLSLYLAATQICRRVITAIIRNQNILIKST